MLNVSFSKSIIGSNKSRNPIIWCILIDISSAVPTSCILAKIKIDMNNDKHSSEYKDSENTIGDDKKDNGQNRPTDNETPSEFINGNVSVNKEDYMFAKVEMEELTQSSSVKLEEMKKKISEYQAAKAISGEAANQTEIGMLLNNPDVWDVIANKILG